jgi:hypothetical protein
MAQDRVKKIMIAVLGNSGIGKSKYLRNTILKRSAQIFCRKSSDVYVPTDGVEIHRISMTDPYGNSVIVIIRDFSGKETNSAGWSNADVCMVIDRSPHETKDDGKHADWVKKVRKVLPTVPIVQVDLDLLEEVSDQKRMLPFKKALKTCL